MVRAAKTGRVISRYLDMMTLTKLENISRRVNRWVAIYISGGGVLAIMAMMVIDATMRTVFNIALLGLVAWSELLMVWVCLAALAYALITGVHVRMSIVLMHLPRRLQLGCEVFAYLVGLVGFAFITCYGGLHFWEAWLIKEEAETTVRSPIWLGKGVIPIAAGLMAFEFLLRLIRTLRVGHVLEGEKVSQ